jgi:hypothetical protein
MSGLGDLEQAAESAVGGVGGDGGGGSLEQDAEHTAVQDGEQELQNVGGQGAAGDVENALGGEQGIEQDVSNL